MKVVLEDHTQNPEIKIGFAASECYDSRQDDAACIKRAAHCLDHGHLSVFRFSYATFRISGISRVCSHQLVRVAHAGIAQKSQRFVKETKVEYIVPFSIVNLEQADANEWYDIQERAERLYLKIVDSQRMKKEDARHILPLSKHAQHEIREVANEINRQLHGIAPNIFKLPNGTE